MTMSISKPRARTVEQHETNLRVHLLPALGSIALVALDFAAIEDYWLAKVNFAPGEPGCPPVNGSVAADQGKPLSSRALQLHLTTLNLVLNRALKRGLIATNPLVLADRPKVHKHKPEPLEREQVRAVLAALRDEEQELQVLLQVALGLRIGEVFALDGNGGACFSQALVALARPARNLPHRRGRGRHRQRWADLSSNLLRALPARA